MDREFEAEWRRARALEGGGEILEAKAIYEHLLSQDSRRLYVRLRLCAIEETLGHYRAAKAHALECASSVRNDRWKDLPFVTAKLLAFDEEALAAELIVGADWHDPHILREAVVLSQHLWLTANYVEALELIAAAEDRSHPSHLLAYSKAQALRYLGRMDEAETEYERCIGLAPSFVYGHWSLATHRSGRPKGSRVQRIRQAQSAFPDEAPQQAYLHYALFKELDDAGQVNEAWASLAAGASIKRKALTYSSLAEQASFSALEAFASENSSNAEDAVTPGPIPIFILGMPRTGTTLLERIVGRHSQVSPGGELNDFHSALCLATDKFIPRPITAEAVAQVAHADFSEIGRIYLDRTRARAKGRRFLTDKNPANFVHVGFIARAMPNARVLCLRRSPMDACMSNLKELFAGDSYGYSYSLPELADHYLRFDRLCAHWKRAFPEQFMEVQYEDLATDPETMSMQVLRFCGLAFEESCLDIASNPAPVATASSSQVRQPINTRGIGAWRRYAEFLEPLRERLEAAGIAT